MLVFVLIVLCISFILAAATFIQSINSGEEEIFVISLIFVILFAIAIVFTSIKL